MQSQSNHKSIQIIWEHLQDADSARLLRQAVELILAEIERDSTVEAFDKLATSGHAEGAPVENNNQSRSTPS
jgi:hypothetical protein